MAVYTMTAPAIQSFDMPVRSNLKRKAERLFPTLTQRELTLAPMG